MKINTTIMIVVAFSVSAGSAAPISGVENHWLANTSGMPEGHIANFLTDMVVYYPRDGESVKGPLAITASFWDEGSCGYCGYKDGASIGKTEWWRDTIHSERAWHEGKKCEIGHLWGRAFLGHNGPPPTDTAAPYVACVGHDTLRSVLDPTALAFDRTGNLLVADNGPDQNIKIFAMDAAKPRLLRTFGDSGGVFAWPVPGRAGARRFWGIRGLGVDSQGNVYVGNTGIPMQVMGGTDIRVFSSTDSALMWQVQGLSFVNSADADPLGNTKSVFLNAKRFEMDWSKTPGASWKLAAATLDPFRYPFDPRIVMAMESVFMRRIGGRLFQFSTSMYGDFLAIHRFVEGSEIAIPAGFISLRDANIAWMSDSAPAFERNETNKRSRWYWMDGNGDGIPQRAEFGLYDNVNIYSQSLDVAEDGTIWLGGQGNWSAEFREGGLVGYRLDNVDERGVPHWEMTRPIHVDVPFPRERGGVGRLKYLADSDVMFLAVQTNYFIRTILRYDDWSDPSRRKLSASIDLGYDDKGISDIRLDQNTADMTLPMSFTADSDFVYVAYLDRGLDARQRGEVTVYDARSGNKRGWITPGPETGRRAGAVDLLYGLNARTQSDGHKVLFVEEDGWGKVEAYRWCPEGVACASTSKAGGGRKLSSPGTRTAAAGRELSVPRGVAPGLFDIRGVQVPLVRIGDSGGQSLYRIGNTPCGIHSLRLVGADGIRSTTPYFVP